MKTDITAPEVRLIIAGGRDFNDYSLLKNSVYAFMDSIENNMLTVISGTARGADSLGEQFARSHTGVELEKYPANWAQLGKSAGYRRNEQMAGTATHLLAFWNGKSSGTKHMIDIAKRKNLTVKVVSY